MHRSRSILPRVVIPVVGLVAAMMSVPAASAQDHAANGAGDAEKSGQALTTYETEFFERYQPSTALDMVRQLPGFLIDNGGASRGYSGALGNILIDDKYPSAKRDTPTALLARIPVGQVARIELIRSQVRDIDLHGKAIVANVILFDDVPAAVQWEANLLRSSEGPSKPGINVSLSDRWKSIDYIVGIDLERGANGESGTDKVFDGDGNLAEIRYDREKETGVRLIGLYLNSATSWGDRLLHLNTKVGFVGGPDEFWSTRVPESPAEPIRYVNIKADQDNPSWEIGADLEHDVGDRFAGKAILLYSGDNLSIDSRQTETDTDIGPTLARFAESITETREAIARYEISGRRRENRALQFNIEGVFNSLDGKYRQTDDTGNGPEPVEVPGANSRVEELRGNAVIKETWSTGQLKLEYGLGAEISEITQTGDAALQRRFFFWKPQGSVLWSPSAETKLRLLIARVVGQLDFADFVSAAVLKDDDVTLGNPNLKPEATWIAETSYERTAGEGAVSMTLFHHWIQDVQDLLPISDQFEVPGNIGDGTRWGLRFEGTFPLESIGWSHAKIDLKFRLQRSSVVDPVTGRRRQLSAGCCFRGPPNIKLTNENDYAYDVAFRQDFPGSRFAVGWDIAEQAERPRFKVNELDTFNEGMEVNVFVETTRWLGIKIRLEVRNLLDYLETRDRVFYEGRRELTPVESLILRDRHPGRRINIVLSGSF